MCYIVIGIGIFYMVVCTRYCSCRRSYSRTNTVVALVMCLVTV